MATVNVAFELPADATMAEGETATLNPLAGGGGGFDVELGPLLQVISDRDETAMQKIKTALERVGCRLARNDTKRDPRLY